MKFSLLVFTILLVFNYQAVSIDAPTFGKFELFYGMAHGFVRGGVEWYVTEISSTTSYNTLMNQIMEKVNNTLICLKTNPMLDYMSDKISDLFAYVSPLKPFDIRTLEIKNIITKISDDIYDMMYNFYLKIPFDCLYTFPYLLEIYQLSNILCTDRNRITEVINNISAKHFSFVNIYLNLIIPYYYLQDYEGMGYNMFGLTLLAIKTESNFFPGALPPSPPSHQPINLTIPIPYNLKKPGIVSIDMEAYFVYDLGLIGRKLTLIDKLPIYTENPKNVNYTITIPYKIKNITFNDVTLRIITYSKNERLSWSFKSYKLTIP